MFGCSVDLCDKEAKIGGMCVKHACDAAKKKYGEKPEEEKDMDSCVKCGRAETDVTGWNAEKRLCGTCIEKTGSAKSAPKEKFCAKCGIRRGYPDAGSFYAGICGPCRKGSSVKEPRPARAEKPPQERIGGGRRGVKPAEPIIEQLLGELRRRARSLVALAGALAALAESEPGVKVPTLQEIIDEVEG